MAPDLRAECPEIAGSTCLFQEITIWAFPGFFRFLAGLKSQASGSTTRCSARHLSDRAHAHHLEHLSLSQTHFSVLLAPFPLWSVFELGMWRMTSLGSKVMCTSLAFTFATSAALNIHMHANAYDQADLSWLTVPLTLFSQTASERFSSFTSVPLVSGPLCLLSAFFTRYSCLSKGIDHSYPASNCISLTSWMYWSPDWSWAPPSAVPTPISISWFTGNGSSSPVMFFITSRTFLLLEFLACIVLNARNLFLKLVLALISLRGSFASSIALSMLALFVFLVFLSLTFLSSLSVVSTSSSMARPPRSSFEELLLPCALALAPFATALTLMSLVSFLRSSPLGSSASLLALFSSWSLRGFLLIPLWSSSFWPNPLW